MKSNFILKGKIFSFSGGVVFGLCAFLCMELVTIGNNAHAESIQRVRGKSIEKTVKQILPAEAELQHKIVNVDLGVLGKSVVALYRVSRVSTNFNGVVLIPGSNSGAFAVTQLPPMREAEGLFDIEVTSVFSVKQETNSKALIVLYRYLRLGTGDDFKYSGYAYHWNGGEWEIDNPRSQLLIGVSKAADAKKKLESFLPK
ncbi:hypothetical protein QZJ86_01770 [Methylomonas montana]|uniref:hypothetical protein n=1 Tax=Methylomonas montana TaxID=3058963 RepID=UPI00265A75A1|nr:hypothetical protein [Methylomonas montana]WKJ90883.1 hypothetical protein QZJ86_01770 [Methylomonas montana]